MKRRLDFDHIKVGDALPATTLTITQEMIHEYAELSGDFNPIHVNLEFAERSEFKGTIAHGCIAVEPILQAICRWTNLPWYGQGTAMHLRYRAPSRPGDTLRSAAKVIEKKSENGRQIAVVFFSCVNQREEPVVTGQWEIVFPTGSL